MNSDEKKAVGQRIKSIRQSKGMTQEEFGKYFKASKGNVATWEKGSSLPNSERLKMIAKMGNLTVEHLLHGDLFTFIITKADNLLSPEKSYLKGHTPSSAIQYAMNEIESHNIALDDTFRVNDIVKKMIDETERYFNNTILKYRIFLLNNPSLVETAAQRLSDFEFYTSQFKNSKDFLSFLEKASLNEISRISSIIEAFYLELDFVSNNEFNLYATKTYVVKLNDFITSGFSETLIEESWESAIYKHGKNNLKVFDYALAIYESDSDLVYITAQYDDDYHDYEYGKNHFVIYEGKVFIVELEKDNSFNLTDSKISTSKVEYFTPLISILF